MSDIDPKALEVAARAIYGPGWHETHEANRRVAREDAGHALRAAAPYLRAQALRDEAKWWLSAEGHEVYRNEDVGNTLEYRADETERGNA